MATSKFKIKSGVTFSVEKIIRERKLFDPGAKLIAGVSGGPDSMALLLVLSALREKWDLQLLVLYCHHGLRPEADQEEIFVKTWSAKWSCPFFSKKLPVGKFKKEEGMSLEEAARELRYRTFEELLREEKADRIVLAHTADDQAEEVLISLIRGAGLGGLAGIPMRRGPIIRPLLGIYRSEILSLLHEQNIPFQVDHSNLDQRFLRARVRHHLLPELKAYSPNILAQLNRTARLLQADEEFLQEKTTALAEKLLLPENSVISISREALASLPQSLGSRLIQQALSKTSPQLRHIQSSHILSILKAARTGRDKGQLPLPEGRLVLWDRNLIRITRKGAKTVRVGEFSYEIHRPQSLVLQETGDTLDFRKITLPPSSNPVLQDCQRIQVDLDKITWPLIVRNSRPGDRFQPLGMKGSKKVSRFFIDRKVPTQIRPRIPLVFSGMALVWVAGLGIAEPFRLDRFSRRALEITWTRQNEL